MNSMKELDREVERIVQAVEHEVPPAVERAFLEEIKGIIPGEANRCPREPRKPRKPRERSFFYYSGLAAAAAVLLAAILFILYLFQPAPERFTAEAEEVWVQDARVEGEPAQTVVINTTDPDITIVWVEKINK